MTLTTRHLVGRLDLKTNRPSVRRLTVTLLISVTVLLLTFGITGPAHAQDATFESGEVVVKLAGGTTIEEINVEYGSTTKQQLLGSAGIYLLQLPNNSNPNAVAARMEADERLVYAEPNFVAQSPEGNGRHLAFGGRVAEPSYDQYASRALELSCARRIGRGEGTTVAVLDTGAQLDHPDLAASFADAARYDFVDDDADPSDRPSGLDVDGDGETDELSGHGTHVAGIVEFVAPEAKIMPLRVLDTEGYGNVFVIAEAITYAQRHGADVINLSLGTQGRSDLLQETIRKATENGSVVVAASGNANTATPHFPAAGEGVLSITAVDRFGIKADFANYGPWVDVAAPGEAIRSALPTSSYGYWSGTSMAAPFVAGQAALARGVNPLLSSAGVEDLIRDTARPLDARNPDYAGMLGAGRANIGASLRQLRPAADCD